MKLSLLKYFAWISLGVVVFSCKSPEIILTGCQDEKTEVTIDSQAFEKTTYKAVVVFQDKEMTGRILIKKTGEENYKIAFYNEMGMTYLEGTLEGKKLIVQNIIPVLDNRLFLRKFKKSLLEIMTTL
jgi:hypothetical protein